MSVGTLFSLTGDTALVTGAGRGIGKGIALGLAGAGAELILLGRPASLAATAEEIERRGGSAEVVESDLRDIAALPATIRGLAERRQIDILVNCAGVIRRGPFATCADEDWDEVMAVNLDAPRILSRELGVGMVERGGGKIINIASLLSFQGGREAASYATSKHAIMGLTRALANEWANKGVQVNAIAPGYIATDNTAALRADADREAEIVSRIPAGRWGTPDDIVGAAIFLAAKASDYVSGHTLVVDGGWLSR